MAVIAKKSLFTVYIVFSCTLILAHSALGQQNHVPVKKPDVNVSPSGLNPPMESLGVEEIPIPGFNQQDDQTDGNSLGNNTLESLPRALNETSMRIEVIQQKYPNGQVQLQRQVMMDEDDNYQNHGFWQLFNEQNQSIAEGHFQQGNMHGPWRRWHAADSGGIFRTDPFRNFAGPFLSVATFENGKLHGTWSIYDSQERKILEMPYDSGKRHGRASWWHPNGSMARQVTFYQGQIEGELIEWNEEREIARRDQFVDGRRVFQRTSWHRRDQMESQAQFYDAKLELREDDNWWDAEPASYHMVDSEFQHGPVQSWFSNGQLQMQGQYEKGQRVGRFTWWHSNGQKQIEGHYETGLRQGRWVEWHINGMKSHQGQFKDDQPVGQWIWWDENGIVTRREDMDIPENSSEESGNSELQIEDLGDPLRDNSESSGQSNDEGTDTSNSSENLPVQGEIELNGSNSGSSSEDDSERNSAQQSGPPLVPPSNRIPSPNDT